MAKSGKAAELATRVTAEAAKQAVALVAEATEKARIVAADAAVLATSVLPQVATVAADLSKHEAVCLERYTGIEKGQHDIKGSLKNIIRGISIASGSIMITLFGIIGWFVATGGLPAHH